MRFRPVGLTLLISAVLALGMCACSDHAPASAPPTPAGTPADVGHHVSLQAAQLPAGAKASILHGVELPGRDGMKALSPTYQLTPSGALSAPTTVTLPLTSQAPAGEEVLVATKEKPSDSWTYLPGRLTADRRAVAFTTTHFSIFGGIGIGLDSLASAFKTQLVDVIDSGMSASASQPSCSGDGTARSGGFSITSTSSATVYWCLGMSGSQRVLKVINNRQYPLELAHPDLTVADEGTLDTVQNLLNQYGGGYTILQPGRQVTFNVNVPASAVGGVRTEADFFGEDVYALDVGLSTLASILTVLGLKEVEGGIKLFDTVVTTGSCASALTQGPSAVLTSCFSATQLAEVFGDVFGVVLSALVAYTTVVQFFRSEIDLAKDHFLTGSDSYVIAITHQATSVGTSAGTSSAGGSTPPGSGTTAPPSSGETAVPAGSGRVDISPCLNLRSGPNGDTALIGCVPDNTVLAVACTAVGNAVTGPYGTETTWDQVAYNGITGYVADAYMYTGSNRAVAAACSSAPASAATGTVDISPCLNLRSGPNGDTSLVGCVPDGTTVTIQCATGDPVTGPYGTETTWDRTTYNGITGYVADAYVYTGTNNAAAAAC